MASKEWEEEWETAQILVGLIDLETKADTELRLGLEFLNIWNMLIASYKAMLMKATYLRSDDDKG